MANGTCDVVQCNRPSLTRRMCNAHYRRWLRHGDPSGRYRMHGLTLGQVFRHYMPGDPPSSGCWEWGGQRSDDGYGVFGIGAKTVRANRVSYALFVGPIPRGKVIRHTCDNRPCVNPAHLIVGTRPDNMRDKVARDRQRKGSACPAAKLTESIVGEARTMHARGGWTKKSLAERFGVSQSVMVNAVNRKTWKHVV